MKKIIRLTESDLHQIVKESVNKILTEHEWWNEEDWNPNYPKDENPYDDYDDPLDAHKRDVEDKMTKRLRN